MPPEAVIAVLGGTIGTLVTVIAYFWRLHQAEDKRREDERDKREARLTTERDEWQRRWEAGDDRVDRFSRAFVDGFKKPAPE